VDPEHIAEVKRIMGIKPKASPYAHLAEVYAIGSEEEEKMAPHLSCEINGVFQCKALCDIGAQVSVLFSKIYEKVQEHNLNLAPTSTKLIMGDGRTIRPLGIACNINVIISGKCIPTNFFVIDAYHSNHDHIILGRPFLKLVDVVLDAGKGKVTMNLNGKKYTYNFLCVSKHPSCKTPDFHRKSESLYLRDSPWISGYRVQNVSQISTQSHTSHHIKIRVHKFITCPLWSTSIQASRLNQSENSTQW
jgi:hypothetical protein